jgi:glycosyltransferase involved in cell wall biosynthesis
MSRVAILPALNEEAGIAAAVASIPRSAIDEIVVVDNGSVDRTAELARAAGACVVREDRGGYGSACMAGVRAAPDARIYVFLDGDASENGARIAELVELVASGRTQLALGVREGAIEPGAMPWQQRYGNRLLVALLNRLAAAELRDLPSLKVIDGPTLRSFGLTETTYGWTAELIARAAFRGAAIEQVRVGLRRRKGRSKVSGSMVNSLRAGWGITSTILRVWREERRHR